MFALGFSMDLDEIKSKEELAEDEEKKRMKKLTTLAYVHKKKT